MYIYIAYYNNNTNNNNNLMLRFLFILGILFDIMKTL